MKPLVWLLPLALAACSAATDTSAPAAPPAPPPAAAASIPLPAAPTASSLATTLMRHHWKLAEARTPTGAPITTLFSDVLPPLQLNFDGERLGVSHACNQFSTSWRLNEGHLETGAAAQTMMACNDPVLLARQDTVKHLLADRPAVTLDEDGAVPVLTLAVPEGATLAFHGELTPQAEFGSAGDTVFLEVAAKEVPCPEQAADACLDVREIHYDANGLRNGEPGAWQAWTAPIDGYEHVPGVRNVLRVKHFTRAAADTRQPTEAWILDMVVESDASARTTGT